jgi:DNA-directed RNA polymerase specialized sigma subunit
MADQVHDEKWSLIVKAKDLGLRQHEIAKLLKISEGRLSQIIKERRK